MASSKRNPNKNYLAKDFGDFRASLLEYARTFFPDKIQDFSEASMGGLFLDMAAAVGDNMSYYLDHQFRELSWSEAVEIPNIERLLRNNGVKITGASPSTVTISFYVEVPAVTVGGKTQPDESSLPIIGTETVVTSNSGVTFSTVEPLDFSEKDTVGNLAATTTVGDTASDGTPLTYILSKDVVAVSGRLYTEQFTFSDSYVPFISITLANDNVTEILSVKDTNGDNWYEVESLTQDTVFMSNPNYSADRDIVDSIMTIIPATKRFIVTTDLQSRTSQLRFGGGDPSSEDDDIFPDPSKFALPTYGRATIPRFTLDPNSLLRSKTFGQTPVSTTLTVVYRAGGGPSHNVSSGAIRTVRTLNIEFRDNPSASLASSVRASVDVTNREAATGGSPPPTIDQLRTLVPSTRNSQSRIVTKADLIARVYSLPSKFGKVFRAGVRANQNNPLASQLFVLSRDSQGRLIQSPDTLKYNLRNFLNEYRLISDAIDVVDARVINYTISVNIVPDPSSAPINVSRDVITSLRSISDISRKQIDQGLMISEIVSAIISVPGVLSVTNVELQSVSGQIDGRDYSTVYFDMPSNTNRGVVVPPPGSIFELRYPEYDIVVTTE